MPSRKARQSAGRREPRGLRPADGGTTPNPSAKPGTGTTPNANSAPGRSSTTGRNTAPGRSSTPDASATLGRDAGPINPSNKDADRARASRLLLVAAVIVAIEGLIVVGFAVAILARLQRDRLSMEIPTAIFLALCGIGVLAGARALTQAAGWARGLVVLAALISVGLATDLFSGSWSGGHLWTNLSAIGLVLAAATILVCVFHPSSTRQFAAAAAPTGDDR